MLPIARVLAFALCASLGYFAARGLTRQSRSPETQIAQATAPSTPLEELAPPPEGQSAFLAEWNRFREENGQADLASVYLAAKDLKDAFRRRAFRAAIIAEWAAKDAKGAFAFLQQKDSGQTGQLIREWLRIDPDGAITTLLANGDKAGSSLRGVLSEVARHAPERLTEIVTALGSADNQTISINGGTAIAFRSDKSALDAFAAFAAKDLEAARSAAESTSGGLRGQALAGVAKVWAEKDGPAAIAWAQALPPGEQRDEVLKATLVGWAKTDPVAALDKIDLVPPGGEENYYASDVGAQVLREAGKKDWDATLRWLSDNPGKLGRSSLSGLESVVSGRLLTDLSGTLRTLSATSLPGVEMILANSLLNDGYAQRDGVWAWLDQQPSNSFTRSARGWVLNAVGWKDPELGLEFLDRIANSAENREIMEQGARSLINGGSQMERFEDLLSKASAKIRPYLLEVGFQNGLSNLANGRQSFEFKPDVWIARLNELPEDRRVNAINGIAMGWGATDPQAALQWATSLQDPAQRTQAFGSAVGAWVNGDVYEASEWINALPAGSDRDTASQSLVGALSHSQPETAWTWATSISDQQTRRSAMQMAFWGLQKKDPGIAQEMLRTANLSQPEMDALRSSRAPW